MGATTEIQWTDATWNPLRGCSKVSAGCANCYAEGVASRFSGPGMPYEGLAEKGRWTGKVRLIEKHLTDPLRWQKPRRVFVNSMSDVFHEDVPFNDVARIFNVMAQARRHSFQVLTKRPERMRAFFEWLSAPDADGSYPLHVEKLSRYALGTAIREHSIKWPLPNVWLGVSIEDQATADERIQHLLRTPAAVRFVSAEPLLGAVRIEKALRGTALPLSTRPRIDWVIVGGESGPNARPMHPDWVRSLRDQCQAGGVPFFFKQWGEWGDRSHGLPLSACVTVLHDGSTYTDEEIRKRTIDPSHRSSTGGWEVGLNPMDVGRVGKKRAGRVLDGRTWDEMPGGPCS